MQQELPHSMVVAVTYLGSRGRNLPVARAVNNIPIEFLSTSRTRDAANETLLAQNVANPVRGSAAGQCVQRQHRARATSCCGRTRSSARLGRGVRRHRIGTTRCPCSSTSASGRQLADRPVHALAAARQAELPESGGRHPRGSRVAERPAEPVLDRHEPADSHSAATASGARTGTTAAEAVLGGWRVSGTYQYQSGFPLTWGSRLLGPGLRRSAEPADPTSAHRSPAARPASMCRAGTCRASTSTTPPVQTNGVDDP